MSNTVKQLGFIPTNRGEFDTTGQTRYYKDNVVQYRNGSYICSPVGYSTSNPTAYTTDAPYQDGDTELNANWKLMASVGLVDEEPVAGSNNLVKSGGIEKYLATSESTAIYSGGNFVTGAMSEEGVLDSTATSYKTVYITLQPKERLIVSGGNDIYYGAHVAVLFTTDESRTFGNVLISRTIKHSEYGPIIYSNNSENIIYLGFCTYSSSTGYRINTLKKAASDELLKEYTPIVDNLNKLYPVTERGYAKIKSISDFTKTYGYIRYSDGVFVDTSSYNTHNNVYTLDTLGKSKLIRIYVGSVDAVPAAIAFYYKVGSTYYYIKASSVQIEASNGTIYEAVIPENAVRVRVFNYDARVSEPIINVYEKLEAKDYPYSNGDDAVSGKGLYPFLAKKETTVSPSGTTVHTGLMKLDGTLDTSATAYRTVNPIELLDGRTIKLNNGNPFWHPNNSVSIFECDSQGNFISIIEAFVTGVTTESSYTNKRGVSMYIGISTGYSYVRYTIEECTEALSSEYYNNNQDNVILKGSTKLIQTGTVEKYLAKSIFDVSPSYTTGAMKTDGTVNSAATTYGYTGAIKLNPGDIIYLNKGQAMYYGTRVAVLYETDSEGNYQSTIISGSGTKITKYTNTSNAIMYVGISGYKGELPYTIEEIVEAGTKEKTENNEMVATRGFGLHPFVNNPYYYHYAPNNFIYTGDGHKAIGSQSLDDIEIAARLGFKFIEANIQVTSDGKFITTHGGGTNSREFGAEFKSIDQSEITTETLQTTTISSKSLDWIKTYVRYDSYYTKYQTAPPTLEEFCECCKINNIGIFLGTSNENAVRIVYKYLGNNVILYNPPSNVRDWFKGYVYKWYNASSASANEMLRLCNQFGAPCIIGIGDIAFADLLNDETLDSSISSLHDAGYLLGTGYLSDDNKRLAIKSGIDCQSADYEVNSFESNNELIEISEVVTTGTIISDGSIQLNTNDTITCGSSSILSLGKGYLMIKFNGSLIIKFGSHGNRIVTSNSSDSIIITDYFFKKNTELIITATSQTQVFDLLYKTSKC